jgi:two-component system response regulator MprA
MSSRILIVDDEEKILSLLTRLFAAKGYEVLTASNGKEALDLLRDGQTVDLIVLDKRMPEMDGFGVLNELKKTGLDKKIPVILLSGELNLDEEHLKKLLKLGFNPNHVLSKPVNLSDLLEHVRRDLKSGPAAPD